MGCCCPRATKLIMRSSSLATGECGMCRDAVCIGQRQQPVEVWVRSRFFHRVIRVWSDVRIGLVLVVTLNLCCTEHFLRRSNCAITNALFSISTSLIYFLLSITLFLVRCFLPCISLLVHPFLSFRLSFA